ncbi:MAG: acetylglutamate kinase [bacterium]|nr:acetylglutamate kinase [bacterium]
MKKKIEKAEILIEALPYIKRFYGKYVVIKYGGAAMVDEKLKDSFATDCTLLRFMGIKPVIVHGGGPKINELMKKIGKKIKFVEGLRMTSEEDMEYVEMVLCRIGSDIVSLLNKHSAMAIGLSGVDSSMIKATAIKGMGFVGDVTEIDTEPIKLLDEAGFIPVITPIGVDKEGKRYNINADTVASNVAVALSSEKLILLTDTKGIYDGETLLSTLKADEIEPLIEKGCIAGGMIPKAKAVATAVSAGVSKAHIIDGRILHSILLEILTDEGIGTQIEK